MRDFWRQKIIQTNWLPEGIVLRINYETCIHTTSKEKQKQVFPSSLKNKERFPKISFFLKSPGKKVFPDFSINSRKVFYHLEIFFANSFFFLVDCLKLKILKKVFSFFFCYIVVAEIG